MAIYSAIDLLHVEVRPEGRAGVWFLNWSIKAKPKKDRPDPDPAAWGGAGLYGLCFDQRLIYVGSYLGNDKLAANLGGDVLSHRWWTHIGAITARGSRVNVARESLRVLRQSVAADHELLRGLEQAQDMDLLHRGAGSLCPLRRLLFAARHADIFLSPNATPDLLLPRFEFIYHRASVMPSGMTGHDLSSLVLSREQTLIEDWAPECNTTHVPLNAQAQVVTLAQADAALRYAMSPVLQA